MFNDKLKKLFLALMFTLSLFGFSFVAAAEEENEPDHYVSLSVIADKTQISGGETIRIGVVHTIYPQWHIYWKNPGDSGTPPMIKWDLPPGYSVSDSEWPAPLKIPYGPLTNYGYEKEAILLQDLTLPANVGSEPITLNGSVDLLVCHEICIPESHNITLTLNNNKNNAEPERILVAEQTLPREQNWQAILREEKGNAVLQVVAENLNTISAAQDLFIAPEEWGIINNNADAVIDILDSGFQITQKRGERTLSEIENFPVVIMFKNAGGENTALRLTASIEQTNDNAASLAPTESNTTLIHALIFALVGGLVLNLMPCVFPVLSMKALSLINLNGKEEKKARLYGLSYTAGILISFGAIGGTLLLLKAGGAEIGWGFQLQNPLVIIFLAYLVFTLGLNLAGFFEFTNKLAGSGQKLTQKEGHKGAFFTGVLATLVATPCTAPFMGAALGFALTQPAIISMAVFLTLGFGLALPYLLLCYVPALRSALPRPGNWMETFRQFLSFPMFITAAWLVWVLSQQINPIGVFYTLLGLIAIAFTLWLIRVMPKQGIMKIMTLILTVISIGFIIIPFLTPHQNVEHIEMAGQNWENYTPEKLETALQGNDPIFVNMTAAWCITCKVNEKIALSHDSARQLFSDKNVYYLKGDWTNQDPIITQYLDSFGRNGVPLYVYYGPRDDHSGVRPSPEVLPQILTFGMIEKTIR